LLSEGGEDALAVGLDEIQLFRPEYRRKVIEHEPIRRGISAAGVGGVAIDLVGSEEEVAAASPAFFIGGESFADAEVGEEGEGLEADFLGDFALGGVEIGFVGFDAALGEEVVGLIDFPGECDEDGGVGAADDEAAGAEAFGHAWGSLIPGMIDHGERL